MHSWRNSISWSQIHAMDLVTTLLPVSPMRASASHRAEMVSQLLFGECARVVEEEKDFVKLRTLHDDYEGWCQRSQLTVLSAPLPVSGGYTAQWDNAAFVQEQFMHLPLGIPLDIFSHTHLLVQPVSIRYAGETWEADKANFSVTALEALAFQYLNTPYLWGGRTVWGIDCSGFVQQLYRYFGLQLPRDAWQQAALGETVNFLQEACCGDLAFFDNAEGKIVHVGMMLANGKIIHAAGQVRVDDMDNMGIVHSTTGARTHQLRIIKRYKTLL